LPAIQIKFSETWQGELALGNMQDVKLEITIERPSADNPLGYINMVAHSLKPLPGESYLRSEDAADGPCTSVTINKVVADLWSYFRKGEKSWAVHVGRPGRNAAGCDGRARE
jgi:hypothetical protein